MISLSELAKKLLAEKKIALICHVRPDGDTIGSACALKRALISKGIEVQVFCEDKVPEKFMFLPDAKEIKNTLDSSFSTIVAIDCADIQRVGAFADIFQKAKNTFVIDHHISNTRFGKTNYVVDNPANAQNVYELIREMGCEIDVECANLLYMGLITDTGNFRHKNVIPETFIVASNLVKIGADFNGIYYRMFSAQSKQRAKLFGKTMSKIRFMLDGRFAIATVMLSDLNESGAKADETEGFIDFVMGIEGVEVGACLLEMAPESFKISFRSKSANVNAVAGSFGGGGHILASGCRINLPYEEVIDRITFAVSRELKD